MTLNHAVVLIPISLLVFSFITFLLGTLRRSFAYPTALVGSGISVLCSVVGLILVLQNGPLHYHLGGWPPPIGIEYVLDHLSAFMAVLVTFIGFISIIYSRKSFIQELPHKVVPLYTITLLLLSGFAGIVVTGGLFNLYVFLEIASLTAYALMAVGEKRAPVASFRYVIMGTVGACFYLLGVGFIYFSTGTLNMADAAKLLPAVYNSNAIVAAAVFIVIGMGLKMALFPMHSWLPDAYTYAPSAVISLIAPLMTKVFAYVLIRMLVSVFLPAYLTDVLPVTTVIGWLAAAGIVLMSIMAIAQDDFRRMLAYSSLAQICYVALGIGLANPLGLIGGMLHILNHAFMKGCLFQVAGAIRYRTGLISISKFNGLGKKMRWTMGSFGIAALSMIGVPPACGFFSKWYLMLGSIDAGNWVFAGVIALSSLLNAVYFFKIIEKVFFAQPDDDVVENAAEPPKEMLVPIVIMAVAIIALGLLNVVIVTNILEPVVSHVFN